MATGILLLLIGAWVVLRTVVPGQDRNLVDLILGKSHPAAGGSSDPPSDPPSPSTPAPARPATLPDRYPGGHI
jgi:hypothetical protein